MAPTADDVHKYCRVVPRSGKRHLQSSSSSCITTPAFLLTICSFFTTEATICGWPLFLLFLEVVVTSSPSGAILRPLFFFLRQHMKITIRSSAKPAEPPD